VVVSELLEILGFTVLSNSLTICSDCDAALASLLSDGDEEVFADFSLSHYSALKATTGSSLAARVAG